MSSLLKSSDYSCSICDIFTRYKYYFISAFIFLCIFYTSALVNAAEYSRQMVKESSEKINLVWQPIVNDKNDLSQINKLPGVNIVSPSWFTIETESGHIKDNSDFLYGHYVKRKGYKIWPLITNDFDPKKTNKWLHNKQSREYIIEQLIFYARRYPIDGYNFDFENIYDTNRDALSNFVEEAVKALHKEGLTVSMDITVQSNTANWSSCYDRVRLGKMLDYVVLMAYDEHGRLSKTAGSVASIKWVENGVKSLTEQVSSSKIILGVPLYMRLWEVSNDGSVKATTLDMQGAEKLIEQKNLKPVWLKEAGQYYFSYNENGKTYKVWQEDAKSIGLKVDLVEKYNLAGVASWRKGFETADIWKVIDKKLD